MLEIHARVFARSSSSDNELKKVRFRTFLFWSLSWIVFFLKKKNKTPNLRCTHIDKRSMCVQYWRTCVDIDRHWTWGAAAQRTSTIQTSASLQQQRRSLGTVSVAVSTRHNHSLDILDMSSYLAFCLCVFLSFRLDPRIHFALVCGAKSCPPIRIFHPHVTISCNIDSIICHWHAFRHVCCCCCCRDWIKIWTWLHDGFATSKLHLLFFRYSYCVLTFDPSALSCLVLITFKLILSMLKCVCLKFFDGTPVILALLKLISKTSQRYNLSTNISMKPLPNKQQQKP